MAEKRQHVKDRQFSGTVVPWHGSSHSAPDENVMCDGTLTLSQEAWADVTTCDKCEYYSRWGIGD
jgi:hypothetical protein